MSTIKGVVFSWGLNDDGQLGNGTNTNSNVPVQTDNSNLMSQVIAVQGGDDHSIVLKDDGTVWGFGLNGSGQLGDGTTTNTNIPVQTINTNLMSQVISISVNPDSRSTFALRSDGTVWAWGQNGNGQLGDGTNMDSDVPVQVDNTNLMSQVIAIAGGENHGLALKSDGIVWAWGLNANGQLGNGTTMDSDVPVQVDNTDLMSQVIAISGGDEHSLALKSDGIVWAWGNNDNGQLGDGTNMDSDVPVQVDNTNLMSQVIAISGGQAHNLALKSDGTAWAWGLNDDGQLGDGTNMSRDVPVQVDNSNLMSQVIAIACGDDHSLALKSDGTVWAWGLNDDGQLGDGTNTSSNVPVQVDNKNLMNEVIAIAGGEGHSLAIVRVQLTRGIRFENIDF